MFAKGKNEGSFRKKSKFNFWSDLLPSHLPAHPHEVREAFVGDELHGTDAHRNHKKFKTSSLRLKKKTSSLLGIKTLGVDDSHASALQSSQNEKHKDFDPVGPRLIEGRRSSASCTSPPSSPPPNPPSSPPSNPPLLSGNGFLGNISFFQPAVLPSPDYKFESNDEIKRQNASSEFPGVTSGRGSSVAPNVGLDRLSQSRAALGTLKKKVAQCDERLNKKVAASGRNSVPEVGADVFEDGADVFEDSAGSPQTPRGAAVWKLRSEGGEGSLGEFVVPLESLLDGLRSGVVEEEEEEQDFVFEDLKTSKIGGFSSPASPAAAGHFQCKGVCHQTGWEARIDNYGRVFYIDHLGKTTCWKSPPACRCCSRSEEERVTADATSDARSPGPALPPAVAFLVRPDFYALLRKNEGAVLMYDASPHLKHVVNKIRKDESHFDKYQHSRDLVCFINSFSDASRRLPVGWEMRFDKMSRAFFLDHSSRTTTFIDPRLPTSRTISHEGVLGGSAGGVGAAKLSKDQHSRSFSVPRMTGRTMSPETSSLDPESRSDKIVAFLRRPDVLDVISSKDRSIVCNVPLRNKIELISRQGVEALHKFSDDLDLNLLLSRFESEILSQVPTSCSFEIQKSKSFAKTSLAHSLSDHPGNLTSHKHDFPTKLSDFYRKLESKGYACGPWKVRLEVMRGKILEDSFRKVMEMTKREMQRNKLLIIFSGEEGLDYGGPSKEFFFLMSRELFNPYYGLFEYSSFNSYTLQISPMSIFLENYLEWFRFAGRIIGLAILHQHLLDVFFVRPFYKALLKEHITLSDLETLDYEYFKSLQWIRDGEAVDFVQLGLTFAVDEEIAGKITEVELKPNGGKIPVTHKNRKDYVDRIVRWRIMRGIKEQMESLMKGFHEVVEHRLISKFDAHELEFVISGTAEIDVSDWRKNTDYKAGYHDNHVVIEWFWSVVDGYSNEMRLRLLQFVTGTSSIPFEGFSALRGHNGPKRFSIEKWGDVLSLPRAHTCFNRLDLPPYTSSHAVRQKLTIAIEETAVYAIE